jgi:predicted ATPase with chaperone activity
MTFVAGGALKPIGGHILSHSSATRMFLRKGELAENNEPEYSMIGCQMIGTPSKNHILVVSHY